MNLENTQTILDGAVTLFKRGSSPIWQVRFRLDGMPSYVIKSTKTDDLSKAKAVAGDLYTDYRYRVKNGLEIGTHTFATLLRNYLESQVGHLSIHRQKYIKGTINRYLEPFFGGYNLAQINDSLIERYWDWRRNFWSSEEGLAKIEQARLHKSSPDTKRHSKLGNVAKAPAHKSLKMEQAVLGQIFDWAVRTGRMKMRPQVKVPTSRRHGVSRRPAFTEAEWQRLYRYLRAWVGEDEQSNQSTTTHAYHLYHRRLSRNYILFMGASGLRPNEARQLHWRDLTVIKDQNGDEQLMISVAPTTKTGARQCVPLRTALRLYERMREQARFTAPDDYVFCDVYGKPVQDFGKTFKKILIDADLLEDSFGQQRTIYSLRHTYATFRLMNSDISEHDLAQNMGTSPMIIFQHYSHVTPVKKAHVHGGTLKKEKSRKGWYV